MLGFGNDILATTLNNGRLKTIKLKENFRNNNEREKKKLTDKSSLVVP